MVFSISMDHIMKKHFCPSADVRYGRSAFLANTNMVDLNHIISSAMAFGKYRFESSYVVYEYTFWEVVGYTMSRGKVVETSKVRCVTTRAGALVTAYPIPKWSMWFILRCKKTKNDPKKNQPLLRANIAKIVLLRVLKLQYARNLCSCISILSTRGLFSTINKVP